MKTTPKKSQLNIKMAEAKALSKAKTTKSKAPAKMAAAAADGQVVLVSLRGELLMKINGQIVSQYLNKLGSLDGVKSGIKSYGLKTDKIKLHFNYAGMSKPGQDIYSKEIAGKVEVVSYPTEKKNGNRTPEEHYDYIVAGIKKEVTTIVKPADLDIIMGMIKKYGVAEIERATVVLKKRV